LGFARYMITQHDVHIGFELQVANNVMFKILGGIVAYTHTHIYIYIYIYIHSIDINWCLGYVNSYDAVLQACVSLQTQGMLITTH